jgi:surfactin synthase thioesterase subunit
MGAIIAFELCRRFRATGMKLPECLFLAARSAPHLGGRRARSSSLADVEFLNDLHRRYGGVPEPVRNDPELRKLFTPLLRADIELVESYEYRDAAPLPVPFVTFAGSQDAEATPGRVEAWRQHSSAGFETHVLPGAHFFINDAREALLRILAARFASLSVVASALPAP